MKNYEKELTPVIYNEAAIKTIRFSFNKENPICFRMHWHERMELLIIREGKIKIDFGTYSKIFSAGEVVIIHPNQPHKGAIASDFVMYDTFMFDIRSFYNDTEICKRLLPPIFDGNTRFANSTKNPEVIRCINEIIFFAKDKSKALYITSSIYKLFSLLYESCVLESSGSGNYDKAMQEIIDYIENNFEKNLTTEFLSRLFKYSKPYFCRKFKASTGLSPMNYIKILRIETAYRLFKDGETDISKASMECGFTDPNYFTRCFKAHFGYPPSHYIKH